MIQNCFVISIVIAINLMMWLLILPWAVNRKMTRFQNDLVNRHYDEVETMYRKMRGWRHDYHNHIQVLKAHMTLQQHEQAAEYLDKLEEDLTTVDATAIVPQDISISGIDLAVLLGNILDNAMEACMQIPEEEERFIRIYIDIVKKQLYLSVTNSMYGTARRKDNLFLSSKEGSHHGFGLPRIDSIVFKYNGYINRQTEKGVFATEVMLPLLQ